MTSSKLNTTQHKRKLRLKNEGAFTASLEVE
jgi:hypothetical protein